MNKFSLFLSTCYSDCYDYFKKTIRNKKAITWDYVCITASNKSQAQRFEMEIDSRKGFLPKQTKFIAIPDYNDKRVGSGGATLSILKELKESYNCDFDKNKILIIHSGGDSKRIPQYSALGKLFSPVPHLLENDRPSTLFDELLISVSYIPTKIKNGSLILSGDVLLIFNNLDFYAPRQGMAAAISFKESIEIGQHHGVYNGMANGHVLNFLHKQPKGILQKVADKSGRINIDTGAVYLSSAIMNSLYSLVDTEEKFNNMVNDVVRLSFYGDFLYPLAEDSTLEKFYFEKPEGTLCDELHNARTIVWQQLRPYRMILESFSQARFVHFGTSKEVHDVNTIEIDDYSYLDWKSNTNSVFHNDNISGYMSVVDENAKAKENVYIESSYVHKNAKMGKNSTVSFIELKDETIPSDVVVHGLKLSNGKIVARLFGINDNPKESKLFGVDIKTKFKELGLDVKDFSKCGSDALWDLDFYPECNNISEALEESLNLYNIFNAKGDVNRWISCSRKSLKSSMNESDPFAIIEWNKKLLDIIAMERLFDIIKHFGSVEDAKNIITNKTLSKNQIEWLEEKASSISFIDKAKLYHFVGEIVDDGDDYIDLAYKVINEAIVDGYKDFIKYNDQLEIVKEENLIKMPLRVNFGGGWSDTPPYCNEHGGMVLNAAILLNGEMPVSVSLKRIEERKIIFKSDDMNVYGEFDDISKLQDTGNPYDEFALQKAVLIATGVLPKSGGDLHTILDRIGGGFIMNSEVTNVPKGSGLGTSSILSACCVKAVLDFFGVETTNEKVSSIVLCVEQIMSTGGGWQDQVGGLYPGIKLITSKPGVTQELKVERLQLSEETIEKLNDRLVLISTGQRRLARNLLRSVISNYLTNNGDTLYALNRIQFIAQKMKEALEIGDITLFGKLLDDHWVMSKTIDKGSTNALIEQIFSQIDDLICGRMVVGAGGGGFLQVVLKKNTPSQLIEKRINECFRESSVCIYKVVIFEEK